MSDSDHVREAVSVEAEVAFGDVLVENTTFIRFLNAWEERGQDDQLSPWDKHDRSPRDKAYFSDTVTILQALVLHERVRVAPDGHLGGYWERLRTRGWAVMFRPAHFYWDFGGNPESPKDASYRSLDWDQLQLLLQAQDEALIVPMALERT